ncbi:3-oxoacyl-ACP synthase III family protein [Antrihabitans sp. YC2-6]|uniref:3-oxoacyl-ACP synthase III family protein n=1 Tax=Antrihabitans sp. YC2-6 TaxID=2799498 RepID=UPI0018F5A0B4|nr:3-oxoacyl-[acyl-carrier-protein] synthase III C-terminal domain-containing protein [Antrihabitans sp. YC2-6]MBJ8347680.1 3-oxoacyl-ACP synthase [Antrihabitans sp. YC2-6]
MDPISLVDVASYLPENRVPTEYFTQFARSDRMAKNIMFRAPTFRHHVAQDETAVDMAERAMAPLIERNGADAVLGVDILLTHTQLPDMPVIGCGADLAKRMGMNPEWILDVHNGGCASFVYMTKIAQTIMSSTSATSALIVAVQNVAGQGMTQTEVRKLAQAVVPGDGCGAGLLRKGDEAPFLSIVCRNYPEFAGDMTGEVDPPRKYWEAGPGQWRVSFTESKIMKVFARGNRLVPEVAIAACDQIGVKSKDVDLLVTNQPNRLFLRNWREALELEPEKHFDTFDECGNLFGAGIPVNLDTANREGRIKNGSLVLMSAFAHAGDFAGAAAVRWGAEPTT